MKSIILCVLLGMCFYLNMAQADEKKGVVVNDAFIEIVPPVEKVTAAYMTIENSSDQEIVLESVSTPVAAITEIHEMSRSNGMMKMRMLKKLPIPAHGQVVLAPGGNHLMLIDLKSPIKQGDTVPVTLHFHDGSSLLVNAKTRPETL